MRTVGKAREVRDETALWANEVLGRAILQYGAAAQIVVAMEELAELIQALAKYLRTGAGGDKEQVSHIREEMADVSIMMNQLEILFGYDEKTELAKLRRLDKRMEECNTQR